jgi:hypothetical protein
VAKEAVGLTSRPWQHSGVDRGSNPNNAEAISTMPDGRNDGCVRWASWQCVTYVKIGGGWWSAIAAAKEKTRGSDGTVYLCCIYYYVLMYGA